MTRFIFSLLTVLLLISATATAQTDRLTCGASVVGNLTTESSTIRYPVTINEGNAAQVRLLGTNSLIGVTLILINSAGVTQQIFPANGAEIIVDLPSGISGTFSIDVFSDGSYSGPYVFEILCDGTDQTTTPEVMTAQLQLITSRGTLTLYVPEPIPLAGLTLVAVDQRPFAFTTRFDSLQLTAGLAPADSCYILRSPEGATEPIPDVCRAAAGAGRVSIANISAADNFWYDSLTNQARAIAVRVGDTPVTDAAGAAVICPGGQPTCTFGWLAPIISATPTPMVIVVTPLPVVVTATPPPAPVVRSYPCDATITSQTSANRLNIVRQFPNSTSPAIGSITVGQGVSIRDVSQGTAIFYQIAIDGRIAGWVPAENLILGPTCP